MELDEYVACMYEGEADRAILDILLDNDKLIFSREELLEEEPIARCKPKDFERRYLRKSFLGKISLLRVIDSRTEQFNLSKAYESKVNLLRCEYLIRRRIKNEGIHDWWNWTTR